MFQEKTIYLNFEFFLVFVDLRMRYLLTRAEVIQHIRQHCRNPKANFLAMDVGDRNVGLAVSNVHNNEIGKTIR